MTEPTTPLPQYRQEVEITIRVQTYFEIAGDPKTYVESDEGRQTLDTQAWDAEWVDADVELIGEPEHVAPTGEYEPVAE